MSSPRIYFLSWPKYSSTGASSGEYGGRYQCGQHAPSKYFSTILDRWILALSNIRSTVLMSILTLLSITSFNDFRLLINELLLTDLIIESGDSVSTGGYARYNWSCSSKNNGVDTSSSPLLNPRIILPRVPANASFVNIDRELELC